MLLVHIIFAILYNLTIQELDLNKYIIYMVQYSIIQHFDQKSGKRLNLHLPVIFKVMHVMSSYVPQNVL